TFRARTRPGPTMGTRPEGRGPPRLLLLAEHPVHLGGADGAGTLGGPPTVGQLDLLALELPLFPAFHAIALIRGHKAVLSIGGVGGHHGLLESVCLSV